MKMNSKRLLKLILQINGGVMSMALFAVFLRHDQMAAIHEWLGLGNFPEGIIVDYLARSLSAFYAIMGILCRWPHSHPSAASRFSIHRCAAVDSRLL